MGKEFFLDEGCDVLSRHLPGECRYQAGLNVLDELLGLYQQLRDRYEGTGRVAV